MFRDFHLTTSIPASRISRNTFSDRVRIFFPGFFQKLLLLGLFFLMLSNPGLSAKYASSGLTTWYSSIVPVLLPAMIFTGILVRTDACQILNPIAAPLFQQVFHLPASAASAWITGMLCGYPSGAAVAGELYRQGRLSREQTSHLLLFCNYPSPMFLTGLLLTGCLEKQVSPLLFLPAVYFSGCLTGFLTRADRKNSLSPETDRLLTPEAVKEKQGFASVLEASLFTAARIILLVGLYIMLFQILAGFAIQYLHLPALPLCFLTGTLEMTSGILLARGLSLPLLPKSCLMLFFAAFGGMSTCLQAISALGDNSFSLRQYLFGRIVHAALAVGLYLALWMLSSLFSLL